MRQVTQNLSDGKVRVVDVPEPALGPHGVLVSVERSLVSVGTERAKVELGRSSLLDKARKRPADVKKVLDRVRREGLLNTYRMVKGRLEQDSPLGYSATGVVLGVGELCGGDQDGRSSGVCGRGLRESRGTHCRTRQPLRSCAGGCRGGQRGVHDARCHCDAGRPAGPARVGGHSARGWPGSSRLAHDPDSESGRLRRGRLRSGSLQSCARAAMRSRFRCQRRPRRGTVPGCGSHDGQRSRRCRHNREYTLQRPGQACRRCLPPGIARQSWSWGT